MSVHVVALAALAGLGIFLLQPERISEIWLLFAGLGALVGGMLLARRSGQGVPHSRFTRALSSMAISLSVACLMAAWGSFRSAQILQAGLPLSLEAIPVMSEFRVQDLPVYDPGDGLSRPATWRFEAEVIALKDPEKNSLVPLERPFSVLLSWAARSDGWLPARLSPGDHWQAVVTYRSAAGSRNFYGFDFETWLFENRVRAVGRVSTAKRDPAPQPIAGWSQPMQDATTWIDQRRDAIRQSIARALPDARHTGVMSGLVVGDQRAIGSADWAVFAETGVSHLMSISGMHVTMFAMLARFSTRLVWQGIGLTGLRIALYIPMPLACAVAASFAAIGYALLAGFNVPAQRTAVMVSVAALASLSGLRASKWGVIALTLLVVLAMDPLAPLAPGFWLSFFAVAVLFGLGDRKTVLGSAMAAQAAITLGIAPLTIAFFQQVSLVGPVANALAIPVVTFLVTPLAMVGAVMAFFDVYAPLVWGHWIFDLLFRFLLWCADWTWASLSWHVPPLWASFFASVGLLVALNESMPRIRHLAWLSLGALFFGGLPGPSPGQVEVTFLDVGQGSAVVVRTASHTLVYDTGPSMGHTNAAERILIPQLYAMGIRRIDRLVVSHGDDDHASGLAQVLQSHKPAALDTSMSSEQLALRLSADRLAVTPVHRCQLGRGWVWDDVWFRFVYPFDAKPADPALEGKNEDSCVLEVIDAKGRRILLTGDIPQSQEDELVARTGWMMKGSASRQQLPLVLLAAHHGSRGSSSAQFLDALGPEAVVFQAGYRSRFNHPHPEVLTRVYAAGATVFRTDLRGDLRMTWQDNLPVFTSAAETRRRFWHPLRTDHRLLGDPATVHVPGDATYLVGSR